MEEVIPHLRKEKGRLRGAAESRFHFLDEVKSGPSSHETTTKLRGPRSNREGEGSSRARCGLTATILSPWKPGLRSHASSSHAFATRLSAPVSVSSRVALALKRCLPSSRDSRSALSAPLSLAPCLPHASTHRAAVSHHGLGAAEQIHDGIWNVGAKHAAPVRGDSWGDER